MEFVGLAILGAIALAVIFLLWFGNHTAKLYRGLYGEIPKPPQQPQSRREYIEDTRWEPTAQWSACTTMAVCSSVVYGLSVARPGGIVRMR